MPVPYMTGEAGGSGTWYWAIMGKYSEPTLKFFIKEADIVLSNTIGVFLATKFLYLEHVTKITMLNPKSEYRNSKQIQITKTPMT